MNHKNGYFKRSNSKGELNWAQRHFVQLRTLKEVEILINEITKRLTCNGIEVPRSGFGIRWTEIEKALVLKVRLLFPTLKIKNLVNYFVGLIFRCVLVCYCRGLLSKLLHTRSKRWTSGRKRSSENTWWSGSIYYCLSK